MNEHTACTEQDVRDALAYISGDDRESWILMGCAIKNEFGDSGFDLWDSWSSTQQGYNKKQIRVDWKAIKSQGGSGSVTIASLFKRAIDQGYKHREIDEEERNVLAAAAAERKQQRQIEAEKERVYDEKLRTGAKAMAQRVWGHLTKVGSSKYLGAKKVGAYGILFPRSAMVAVCDLHYPGWDLLLGDDVKPYLTNYNASCKKEQVSVRVINRGCFAVPLVDSSGEIQNLQIIYPQGGKKFLKGARKSGCWHLIGNPELVDNTLLICEGYATAASIHEATGFTVAVAFDAGNLKRVALALRKLYPTAIFMLGADDDHATEAAGKGNPGKEKAAAAAEAVSGYVVLPSFQRGM